MFQLRTSQQNNTFLGGNILSSCRHEMSVFLFHHYSADSFSSFRYVSERWQNQVSEAHTHTHTHTHTAAPFMNGQLCFLTSLRRPTNTRLLPAAVTVDSTHTHTGRRDEERFSSLRLKQRRVESCRVQLQHHQFILNIFYFWPDWFGPFLQCEPDKNVPVNNKSSFSLVPQCKAFLFQFLWRVLILLAQLTKKPPPTRTTGSDHTRESNHSSDVVRASACCVGLLVSVSPGLVWLSLFASSLLLYYRNIKAKCSTVESNILKKKQIYIILRAVIPQSKDCFQFCVNSFVFLFSKSSTETHSKQKCFSQFSVKSDRRVGAERWPRPVH